MPTCATEKINFDLSVMAINSPERTAKIMSGIRIGDGATIAGSAVVTRDVAPYSVVGGVPARHIKYRVPEERIPDMLDLAWWDWPIEKIADAVPVLQSGDIDALFDFDRRWGNE